MLAGGAHFKSPILPWLLSQQHSPFPRKVYPKMVGLKMLDFSDRTGTGISFLISATDTLCSLKIYSTQSRFIGTKHKIRALEYVIDISELHKIRWTTDYVAPNIRIFGRVAVSTWLADFSFNAFLQSSFSEFRYFTLLSYLGSLNRKNNSWY